MIYMAVSLQVFNKEHCDSRCKHQEFKLGDDSSFRLPRKLHVFTISLFLSVWDSVIDIVTLGELFLKLLNFSSVSCQFTNALSSFAGPHLTSLPQLKGKWSQIEFLHRQRIG